MKKLHSATFFFLSAALTAISLTVCGCNDNSDKDSPQPQGHVLSLNNITSLNITPDSSAIWAGSSDDDFFCIDPSINTVSRYTLPNPRHYNTYCIMEYSPNTFLVCRQNSGVALARYDNQSAGNPPVSIRHISAPKTIKPDKGLRFSTYHLADCGDKIVLGTSNGLMYIERSVLETPHNAHEDTITAKFVSPPAM